MRNQLIVLSDNESTLRRPTAKRPDAQNKIDDRTDIVSRVLSVVPPRNAWARFATKEEHGTAQREESLGGQFFRKSSERAK